MNHFYRSVINNKLPGSILTIFTGNCRYNVPQRVVISQRCIAIDMVKLSVWKFTHIWKESPVVAVFPPQESLKD